MELVLTAGGLQQGFEWMNGTEWVDTITRMRPYWLVRTVSGLLMDTGMTLLVLNCMMTAIARPVREVRTAPGNAPAPVGAMQ